MRSQHRRLRVLAPIVAMTVGGLLHAQVGPTTRPFALRHGMHAWRLETQPATQPATQPSTRPTELRLNFKDAPLDAVLDYLSDAAGFVVVKEGPVDGRVTVLSKQPVSPEEAVTILNATLKANGFVAIRAGRELKIVAREKAKKGNIPVHFGEDPADVADSDELITQVIPIQNVDATKLKDDLKPLLGTDMDVTANDGSNTIVMTDTSSSIRRIVQIIRALDQEETTVSEMRIVQLKFANAADTVKLIEAIFKSEGGQAMNPQQIQQMQQRGIPVPPGGAGGARRARGQVIAAADDRTNTLVLSGPADALKIIDGILAKLDSDPVPAAVFRAFPLKYADAESTSKLVESIFNPQQQDNSLPPWWRRGGEQSQKPNIHAVFDDRTNTVIVTAPAEAMKEVEGMIKSLDASPVAASDFKVFALKYADSDSVAKMINSIFNPNSSQGPQSFWQMFYGGGSSESAKGVKVNATSDWHTNTLIVTAPAETMKMIEGIIDKMDSNPASEDTLFIYHLRSAQSSNLETVLNVLFGNVQPGQGNQNGQQQNQNQNRQTNRGFGNGIGGSQGFGQNGNNNTLNRNNQNNRNRPGLPPGAAQPQNDLAGMVFVVADQDTNSLIVTTKTKYEKEVRAIIAELDHPVPQVLIKVLVAEVTHDNSADFGTDFSVLNTRSNGNGQIFNQTFGQPGTGMVVSVLEDQLNVTLHALAVQGKLDVLSRPYILGSDNQLAEINIGQFVPLINSVNFTEFGNQINNLQYEQIGITLDVTPHINPDGLVVMDVAPSITQLTDQSVPITSTSSEPVISDRSAQTRVAIRDGQTIVIGGMMEDKKTLTINKVPILGDIPILKLLFSRTQESKTKTELLFFITPHVAQQPGFLESMTKSELGGTKLTPHAVAPGVFDEHMRNMQRGEAPASTQPAAVSPVFSPMPSPEPAPTGTGATPNPSPSTRPAATSTGGTPNASVH